MTPANLDSMARPREVLVRHTWTRAVGGTTVEISDQNVTGPN